MNTDDPTPLLNVNKICVDYPTKGLRQPPNRVIRDVSFEIREGETLGLVGESGSGKSTIGRAILGLAPVVAGSITFRGTELVTQTPKQRRKMAQKLQVVFQDPFSSLNPSMTIEDILCEPLTDLSKREAREHVRSLLDQVALPSDAGRRYAREFSGGQRQRIAIARALAISPELIICDEPTSGLDLSTQSRVLDLLVEIQERTGVAYLFITHDLAVVRKMSHRIMVLLGGEAVEAGSAQQVTEDPQHPYTQRLLMAAPIADPVAQAQRRADRAELIRHSDETTIAPAHTVDSGREVNER
ncbi:ABC transporter ATP-binding protein [Microbacterium marmarense]|uniref:ATP-binding cassette domain-containing protein n=1 Tax=Microbacterium marmarense TaxID=3122051 RepID=A0ABU8LS92_9MICO